MDAPTRSGTWAMPRLGPTLLALLMTLLVIAPADADAVAEDRGRPSTSSSSVAQWHHDSEAARPSARPPALVATPSRGFQAATWNLYNGTPLQVLRPVLRGLLRDDVTVLYLQEASKPGLVTMLRQHGLRVHRAAGRTLVAWDPTFWQGSAQRDLDLARTHYYRKGGTTPVPTPAAGVVLTDRAGRSLTTVSYHLPPGIQERDGTRRAVPRRIAALRESMRSLSALGRAARTDAVLFGGDDNVDEARGSWAFMRRGATGMRQVAAPRPTMGHPATGRWFDDYRVRGDLRVGRGGVRPGGGDHRVHVRTLFWR